jgi:DNA-binding transcriptional regulator YdaS (Cro superfamily)
VLNSATLAPLSLSQVSSAMVRTAAADSESAARIGPVTPEQARPAIDPASMVTLLTASAEMPPQEVGAAGSEARLAVQTARGKAGSRLSTVFERYALAVWPKAA